MAAAKVLIWYNGEKRGKKMTRFITAKWLPISNNCYHQRPAAHNGLIMHVQVGNGGLQHFFNEPATEASAYFWAPKSFGNRLEQYLDTDTEIAWAQGTGNATYLSVETEGYPNEDLTLHQIFELAKLYKWGHRKYNWPYRLAERPGEKGFGWHGMGGEAWGGHFSCPGDIRKARRKMILRIAQGRPVYVSKKKDKKIHDQLIGYKKRHKIKNRTGWIGYGVRKAANI